MEGDALVIACTNGNTQIVSDLLQSGVSADSLRYTGPPFRHTGPSCLIAATSKGHIEIAKLLLHHKAQVDLMIQNCSALTEASTGKIVQLLLDHGAQVDLQGGGNGKTALIAASKQGRTEVVRVLLNNKAQVDLRDSYGTAPGMTALMCASANGSIEIVKLLLENKAQVDLAAEIFPQPNALLLAILVNHTEMVQLLLDHGAQVNWKDNVGDTALIYAAKKGETFSEIIKLLLHHGAERNLQNNTGKSALTFASASDCPQIVNLLITHGKKQNDTTTTSATGREGESEFPRSEAHPQPQPLCSQDFPPTPVTSKHFTGFQLNVNDIVSFLKSEGFSSASAETLGLELKISKPKINTLKKNHVGDADALFYDVIDSWINLTEPTLKELANALDKSDYKRIAGKLRATEYAMQDKQK